MDNDEVEVVNVAQNRDARTRDLIAFWIFGLCNNYGYVVMLTAAIDILHTDSSSFQFALSQLGRECTTMSTGAILLADIIPSFIIKSLSPFLPYNTSLRVVVSCLLSAISFLAVATAGSRWVVVLGVILTSFASGLGEPTFLAHSTHYNKNVVSTWSSGTGGAGIIGAVSYSILREVGLTSRQTLLLMILVPTLELFTFNFLLTRPNIPANRAGQEQQPLINNTRNNDESPEASPLNTLAQKFAYIPELMIYFVPLSLVYFFEYFINQGLFELIKFPNSNLSIARQYRYYQITYQIGVFASRSSVNIVQIKRTWLMAIIQGFIATFFLFEAIYLFTPSISIIIFVIFIEGLQGGLAYVNTYYRMSREIPSPRKEFAMNVVASSDSIGIILAGFLAIPTHNWICQLPDTASM